MIFPAVDLIVRSLVNRFSLLPPPPTLNEVLFLCTVSLQTVASPGGLLRMSRQTWQHVKWNAQGHAWCRNVKDQPLLISASPPFFFLRGFSCFRAFSHVTSTSYSSSDLQWVTVMIHISSSHWLSLPSAEGWGGNEKDEEDNVPSQPWGL